MSHHTRWKVRLFPPLSECRFALLSYILQSGVDCNGNEFDVVRYPFANFELLLFQMPMQAEASKEKVRQIEPDPVFQERQAEEKPSE